MFQRIGPAAYKPSLDNTIKLLNAVGNPQENLTFIHVAGTNGKGSVSNMLSAVLQASGYRTGLYTSPHLSDFRERIKVNGLDIPKDHVVSFVKQHRASIEQIQPSFFELCVALAMHEFRNQACDYVVLETGMGGRLDSTNVVIPLLSIITNISYDHQQFLGDTIPQIASEKAGIIKAGVPVLIGIRQEETESVFELAASKQKASLYYADDLVNAGFSESEGMLEEVTIGLDGEHLAFRPSLRGLYQKENIRTVLAAIRLLRNLGLCINSNSIGSALSEVHLLTGFAGRWDVMQKKPLLILDTAHNIGGISKLLEQLKGLAYRRLRWVWGMVSDKNPEPVIDLLPEDALYYLCKPDLPRAMDTERLALEFGRRKLHTKTYSSTADAFFAASGDASEEDLILVAGSTFTVAEVLQFLKSEKNQ